MGSARIEETWSEPDGGTMMGMFRLGVMLNFLSHPVIAGFVTAGFALLNLPEWRWAAVIVGLGTAVALQSAGLRRLAPALAALLFGVTSLLIMFELETYALDDKAFEKRWVGWGLHGARLVCYVGLAHTVFANSIGAYDAWNAPVAEDVTSLCQVVDRNMSWGNNYDYHELTLENCDQFTTDSQFRMIDPLVITDSEGWAMEKKQTLIALIDSIVWLLVIWAVELAVWLQNRNITGGTLMLVSHAAKALYAWLFIDAAWWTIEQP